MRLSQRLVVSDSPGVGLCRIAVREIATQTIRISVLACCVWKLSVCVARGADKNLFFADAETAEYDGAQEITFHVRAHGIHGAVIYSATLTGGEIALIADNKFLINMTAAESALLPVGRHYAAAWVTTSTGDEYLVGQGNFDVIDTRKHDE